MILTLKMLINIFIAPYAKWSRLHSYNLWQFVKVYNNQLVIVIKFWHRDCLTYSYERGLAGPLPNWKLKPAPHRGQVEGKMTGYNIWTSWLTPLTSRNFSRELLGMPPVFAHECASWRRNALKSWRRSSTQRIMEESSSGYVLEL